MAFELPNVEELIDEAIQSSAKLYGTGRFVEGEIVLNQLLKVDPENVDGLELLGLMKHAQKQYKEGAEFFEKVLVLEPDRAESHNNLSLCYSCLDRLDEAMEHVKRAIELIPDRHYFHTNLALQYKQSDNYPMALETFEKGMAIKSDDAGAWANLGATYGHMKDLDKALECYDKACELDGNLDSAFVDRGYANALAGRFQMAWPDMNHRMEYFPPVESFKKTYNWDKLWDGEASLTGKKIVIWCEQGAGDLIQFTRFLPKLKERGCTIWLHTAGPLISLFEANNYADEIKENFGDQDYDYHCSIMNLPMLLGIGDEDLGPGKPMVTSRDADLSQYDDMIKIGIVWAGNPRHPSDQRRSTYLQNFRKIHDIPGVKLFNLQKDLRVRAYTDRPDPVDFAEDCDEMNIIDTSPFLDDFEDTAAIIQKMDLIITVDTVVLHIAASLDVPTFGLIHYNPDWRWTTEGESTIWYPNLRLFRQPERDNWDGAFEAVTQATKEFVEKKQND